MRGPAQAGLRVPPRAIQIGARTSSKNEYDATNFFRLNQKIKPAAAA
jgi:hypothetical protein